MPVDRLFDVAIVGAGISGLAHLRCARDAGLDALALEARDGVGGLWRDLPSWQDIQIGTLDWSLGDLPMDGPTQPDVLANIVAWADRFALSDGVRLGCPVRAARHADGCWELDTPQGTVRARHLVASTGAHNVPEVPDVRREQSTVRELHSSELWDATELAGRDIVVVGGGASAFDLLDQCFEHGARRIVWVYRHMRWFVPTNKPKTIAGSVRPFAKMQVGGMTLDQQTALIGSDLLARYKKCGIQAIQPDRPFDVLRDQLIPGRARMLANFGAIETHRGVIEAIVHDEVRLTDGTVARADLVLWGTGYRTDLTYFEDRRIAAIRDAHDLASRCVCVFRSKDAPNLYFPAVGLDGTGTAPWHNAVIARSIMSHIRGTARLDMEPAPHKLNHFDMVRYLADRDPGTYAEPRGWEFYRQLVLNTPDDQTYPFP
jgi:cation diffusion facilitator CzcD-associated flavoprotein CzcO